MNAARWQQLNRVFEQALEFPASERGAFLAEACADDADLLEQAQAMLAADGQPELLLDQPVRALAQKFFAPADVVGPGQRIGSYRLLRELGRGGMGQVFLAEDTRLGRQVALKLLPAELTNVPDRVARFQREARAASALNHPNILTIYDFGQQDAQHYIAAEYVEGQTLRACIGDPQMTLSRALDVVAQISGALAVAHAAGIIHRDIKPENVMLRPDGYVKVLDFGLAKLTQRDTSAPLQQMPMAGPEARTRAETLASDVETLFKTQSGVVLGTISYMSPEQTKGQPVDARTDIFSLGVVLYELLTGRHPFARNSRAEIIAALLEHDPPPLTLPQLNAPFAAPDEVPAELQPLLNRTLAKDRAQRFASAAELQAELKRVKQWLDAAAVNSAATGQLRRTAEKQVVQTSPQHTSSTKLLLGELRQHKFGAPLLGLALLVLLVAAGFGIWQWLGYGKAARAPFEKFAATRLTGNGNVLTGAISPDGKYLALVEEDANGARTLRVRQMIAGGSPLSLVALSAAPRSVAFSPDSNFLYYTVPEAGQATNNVLYRVALLGGEPHKLLTDLNGLRNSSFSPDGREVIFRRHLPGAAGSALIIANADGSNQRTFATFTPQQTVWGYAWSPDGASIAYSLRDDGQPRGKYYYLAEKSAQGGAERMIVAPQPQWIAYVSWLPDGRGLLANAMDEMTGRFQLFYFSYPDGAKRQLTHDSNNYASPVVTADGHAVLLGQTERPSRMWVAPLADLSRARQLTPGQGSYDRLTWTPDGRLVHDSLLDLWLTAADGRASRQLTTDAKANTDPALTPDGNFILFASRRAGRNEIWRMEIDGGNLVQLSTNGGERPQCTPDGRWVIYESESEGTANQRQLWKVSLQGGTPERLFDFAASNAAIAPNGQWLACELDDPATKAHGVAVVALADGRQHSFFKLNPGSGGLVWTRDATAIIYIDAQGGSHQIKQQALAGGPPKTLLENANEAFFTVALSWDGRQLAYTSGRVTTDLVLLTESK